MVIETGAKDDASIARSVIDRPDAGQSPLAPGLTFADNVLWAVASAADDFQPWGYRSKLRDQQLRAFWPTESYFASGLGSIAARNAAFSWELRGGPRVVSAIQRILENANEGEGWHDLVTKLTIDVSTQDNGAFMEVVRTSDSPTAPLIGLNHLDSWRCYHTGDPRQPVLYYDRKSRYHLLKWYEVVTIAEMPTPVEGFYGLQYCVLTLMLRAAQILKNIFQYQFEKTGGRFNRAVHIVSGVTKQLIEDAIKDARMKADEQGLMKFMIPIITAAIDPQAKVDVKTLELASLPDNFSQEEMLRWYIVVLASAFRADYQEFAPLPGNRLGSGQQSEMLHLKSQGKGAGLFRKMITHAMNQKILPSAVEFAFHEQDIDEENAHAELRKTRSEARKIDIDSGVLTAEAARQQALDDGDISEEIFNAMGVPDLTADITLTDAQEPDTAPLDQPQTVGQEGQNGGGAAAQKEAGAKNPDPFSPNGIRPSDAWLDWWPVPSVPSAAKSTAN